MTIDPIILEGRHVRLEPLTTAHCDALREVGLDPELWRWIPYGASTTDEMRAYVKSALDAQAAGTALPFATVEPTGGQVVGSTRYMNIDVPNRRVEIGATWIAKPWRRTAVNTEAKYLMLRHAFETLGCVRVELKTDVLNQRSPNAILRTGATDKDILPHHLLTST